MEFGFPVILKAAAGGGGRGMRRCDTVEEVGVNFDLVKAEAKKAAQPAADVDFNKMTVAELKDYAKEHDIKLPSGARKADIIETITSAE